MVVDIPKDVTDPNGQSREEIRGLFGMVFQDAALVTSLSISDNVGLGLRKKIIIRLAENLSGGTAHKLLYISTARPPGIILGILS